MSSNLCDPDPPTSQTDGQTDGQHAISIPRDALVHSAVTRPITPNPNLNPNSIPNPSRSEPNNFSFNSIEGKIVRLRSGRVRDMVRVGVRSPI